MNGLFDAIKDNLFFVGELVLIVAAVFLIAYIFEKLLQKKNGINEKILTTRKMTMIGLFSALATILMMFEIPVFFAPPFYKIDLSEIPVLICTFAFGPVAGVLTETVKILLKLVFKSTSTAFVGELANFVIGCSFILPAVMLYDFKKSKKAAMFSCVLGTAVMTIVGSAFNGIYLLPKFAELYGMPLDALIAMGTEVNASIKDVTTFVVLAVMPMNLLKGVVISVVTMLVYKRISRVIKSGSSDSVARK
ncbi:MAG: ECF transporter S component [Lachnospiraceae bacterium]|nr:ECF transporter S component [Lachnospiraceae bacterium]